MQRCFVRDVHAASCTFSVLNETGKQPVSCRKYRPRWAYRLQSRSRRDDHGSGGPTAEPRGRRTIARGISYALLGAATSRAVFSDQHRTPR